MAAAQVKIPLAPQAIINPRHVANYAQWYTDQTNNPFQEGYAPMLQAFAAGARFNIAPAMLLEQAIGSTQGPQAFLVVTPTVQGHRISCLTRPA